LIYKLQTGPYMYLLFAFFFYSCEDLKVTSLAIHHSKIDLLQSRNYPNCEGTSLCTSFLSFNPIAGMFDIQSLFFSSKRLLTYFVFNHNGTISLCALFSKIKILTPIECHGKTWQKNPCQFYCQRYMIFVLVIV